MEGDELPSTPTELMRSRYSAYALGEVDYIIETTDPDGDAWEKDLDAWRATSREFGRSRDFGGVSITHESAVPHGDGDGAATVTFHARLSRRGADLGFVEESHFVRRNGRWLYSWGRFPT